MNLQKLLFLKPFAGSEHIAILLLRLLVGSFLMWETWDNVSSAERMGEFVTFMEANGFIAAGLLAPLSVWAQFICGALLIVGLLTRWAGLVMVLNFVTALIMVHLEDPFRGQFPALILIGVSFLFYARGAGRFGIDRFLEARINTTPSPQEPLA